MLRRPAGRSRLSWLLSLGLLLALAASCGGDSSPQPNAEEATATQSPAPATTPEPEATPAPENASSPLAEDAERFLAAFTRDHSPRASATEQELAAALALEEHLETLGYETALQDFTVTGADAEVSFEPAPDLPPDGDGPQPLVNSGEGTATASLVSVGRALEGDVPSGGLQGRIALIERGDITFQEKVHRVAEAGALAALIYNNEDGGFLGSMDDPSPIPALSLDRETGLALLELMNEGAVEASISVTHTASASRNVVAEKPGSGEGIVIVGAHYDTVPDVPGANDSGSGVAGVVTVAGQIADREYPFTVRLVLFGSQAGLAGSSHYVAAMSEEERANTLAMINFDVIGSGSALEAAGEDDLFRTVLALGWDLGASIVPTWSLPGLPTDAFSDHSPFAEAGIASVALVANDISRIRSSDDTMEYIDGNLIGWAAEIAIALLDDLASPD